MKQLLVVVTCLTVLVLSGCSLGKKGTRADAGAGAVDSSAAAASGAGDDTVTSAGMVGSGEDAEGPTGEMLSRRIIYFDYDSAEIRADSQQIVAAHARYLANNAATRVRLEGHADERGSREYNIGLGERRAQAVRRMLLLQGVAESQLGTVSYGEERPAVAGSDEDAYAQNRRVEIIYIR
ncbi:MAG TPA: peptidoglycan-associated lipoprotein Pal [Steroidobacteraceae bacterium]|nr:peptidoglycan-associated lipoprotein Pal [Steroidobacteraceae bacterium]HRX89193.1 peptidoglycan-associated lipoprotein Pal [Steroidobacteraceae bacterium]